MSFIVAQAITGLASAASLFLIAVGLSIVFGVTRVVNFAHGSLYILFEIDCAARDHLS